MSAAPASFSARIIASIVIATAAVTIAVAFLARAAILEVDEDAVQHQRIFVARGLKTELERIPVEQQASTIWDEALLRVRAGDQEWMDENVSIWTQTYYGHDLTYVLAPDGRPIHGAISARRMPPEIAAQIEPPLASLARQARKEMAEAQREAEDPVEAINGFSVTAMLGLDGRAVLASVTPILPDSPNLTQPAGDEYLHIAVQYVDDTLAARIGEGFSLRDAAFVTTKPGEEQTSYAVTDAKGDAIAWFTWTPDRPGSRLAGEMAPVIGFFGAFCLLVLFGLIARLWVSSRNLQKSEAEARYLANHDALAGLPNRMHFDERLTQALQAEQAGGPAVTLLSVDVDHFKMVNDTMGHAAGDELIRQVSTRMLAQVRRADTVARLGGDEFGIVLVGMGGGEALASFCAGLVHVLALPYQLKAGQAHVSASIGVAAGKEVRGGIEAVQRSADAALYRAKADGRGRYCIFTEEMDDVLRRRHEIERNLREALLVGDQLDVEFQPIFNHDGSLYGAEALARWPGAPNGPVPPVLFITIAEDCGLIQQLGLWVLKESCAFAATAGLPRISVNVSAVQLRSADFSTEVLQVLSEAGLPPGRLELELTERCAVDTGATTQRNLKELRAAGVSIALDDFATGQSLLQYVRDFDIDVIKIDQSFVSRLGTVDGTDQVVRALVDLGHAMGLEIVAEGVETGPQRDALIAMGCHIFQGFLLGRPMSRAAFTATLATTEVPLLSA